MCVEGACMLQHVCVEVKGQLAKGNPSLHHWGTGVVRLDGKRCPCSLSTPAWHRPQTVLWIQQHTHGDRHLAFLGSVTSCDMQAFLEISLPLSPHVPPSSSQTWEEGMLRADPAPCPHSQNDTRSISDVCPGTDLRLSLGSWLSPKRVPL